MTQLASSRTWAGALAAAGALVLLPMVAAAQTALPPPGSYGQADARQDRIEELEGQLREATAANERVQFELIQANREIARLRGMMGELAAANQSLATPDPALAPTAPPATPAGGNPEPQTAQQRATGTLGTLPASAVPATPPPAAPPATEAGPAYSAARQLLVDGRYAEAEAAFTAFLAAHGSAETAPDARYWLAFTLLARNNYADAAANFVTYLQTYRNGPRAPDAQVRLGMALAGMGDQRQACSAFNALPTRYPRAPQNVRDLAVREARANNCAA
jgi:tol-pal system protein YbgF